MIRLILKTEMRSAFNYWKSMGETKVILYIIMALLFMLLPLPLLGSLLFTLTLSLKTDHLSSYIMILSLAAIVILTLLSIHFIIKDMILSANVPMYLSFPISAGDLFWAKFIKHAFLHAAIILMPISMIVGVALAIRFEEWMLLINSAVYFLGVGVVITSLAYLCTFLTAHILPAKKVSGVLSFVGAASFILVYLAFFALGDSIKGWTKRLPESPVSFDGFLYGFDVSISIIFISSVVGLAVVMAKSASHVTRRAMVRGWNFYGHSGKRMKSGTKLERVVHPIVTLMRKDLKMTVRDFKELAVLLPYYLLPLFLIYVSGFSGQTGTGTLDMTDILISAVGGTLVMSLFVGAYNTARDAEHFAMLKALPLKGSSIAVSKYLFTLLTTVPVMMVAFTVVWYLSQAAPGDLVLLIIMILLSALTAVPIGMMIGSKNPVVSYRNPRKRLDTLSNVMISFSLVVVLMLTGVATGLMDGSTGVDRQVLIVGSLVLPAVVSIWLLRKVAKRYDKGFKITYKE